MNFDFLLGFMGGVVVSGALVFIVCGTVAVAAFLRGPGDGYEVGS